MNSDRLYAITSSTHHLRMAHDAVERPLPVPHFTQTRQTFVHTLEGIGLAMIAIRVVSARINSRMQEGTTNNWVGIDRHFEEFRRVFLYITYVLRTTCSESFSNTHSVKHKLLFSSWRFNSTHLKRPPSGRKHPPCRASALQRMRRRRKSPLKTVRFCGLHQRSNFKSHASAVPTFSMQC